MGSCTGQFRSNGTNEKHTNKAWKYAQRYIEQMGSDAANASSKRLERRTKTGDIEKSRAKTFKQFTRQCKRGYWRQWPSQSPICGRDDGLPDKLDGITFSKWRRESIKLYGNAIVPQLALQLFKAIETAMKQ